eukprot:12023438-Prorocentrum_lima.AAC.1
MHQNTDHRGVIMEIKTLHIESSIWVRDTIALQHICVKYTPGKNSIAYGLTKVLQKEKLREARE